MRVRAWRHFYDFLRPSSEMAILPGGLHRWRKTGNFLCGRQFQRANHRRHLGLLEFIIREKHGRLLCRRRKSKRRLAAREETPARLKRNAPINRHVWTFAIPARPGRVFSTIHGIGAINLVDFIWRYGTELVPSCVFCVFASPRLLWILERFYIR